jgi:hypothetical protein
MHSKTITRTPKAATKRPVHEYISALVFLETLIWKEGDKIEVLSLFFFEKNFN